MDLLLTWAQQNMYDTSIYINKIHHICHLSDWPQCNGSQPHHQPVINHVHHAMVYTVHILLHNSVFHGPKIKILFSQSNVLHLFQIYKLVFLFVCLISVLKIVHITLDLSRLSTNFLTPKYIHIHDSFQCDKDVCFGWLDIQTYT